MRVRSPLGNGYRLIGDANYKPIVLQAAGSVASRYSSIVGCVKVSDNPNWHFPVNIDSIMNMELLFWAGLNGGSPEYFTKAQNHAQRQIQDLVRPDGSTFHYADYNPSTGNLIANSTWQGYSTNSTWSRGQAWAIYGFTMSYRYTADSLYFDTACHAADYYLDHLTVDSVPYWDFNAPGIPNTVRDTSAASVTASGLFELSKYCAGETRARYYNAACSILKSLCTPDDFGGYLSESGTGYILSEGILMHGCYHGPDCPAGEWASDESTSWGDYYFIEALLRYKNK
jgi:unsaturated chondroitin disaccharide hydrolase